MSGRKQDPVFERIVTAEVNWSLSNKCCPIIISFTRQLDTEYICIQ